MNLRLLASASRVPDSGSRVGVDSFGVFITCPEVAGAPDSESHSFGAISGGGRASEGVLKR